MNRRILRPDDCAQYRPALLGLLEAPGEALHADARAHLDGCRRCRSEMEAAVLTGVAVRRAMAEASVAVPPADAWPRLRQRVDRGRSSHGPGRAGSPLLGAAMAAGLAIALLVPLGQPMKTQPPLHESSADESAVVEDAGSSPTPRPAPATVAPATPAEQVNPARVQLMRLELAPESGARRPARSLINQIAE